ncbi:MAG TPA: glycosyltransferase, partial [Bacteroidales bacterium]|nr:glycosyltransferase [Bacteroidales bacterium]
MIRQKSRAAIIYRAHNIEHLIWKGLASSARNPFLKTYLNLLANRLEKYELNVIDQVDALIAISTTDHDFFLNNGFKGSSVLAPVMVPEHKEMFPLPEPEPGTVFHLGSMDWRPNREGMLWFLKEVWPRVLKKAPEMRFFLAGKGMPARFFHYSGKNNVTVFGEVPSAAKFMADKHIMVVPLLSGSGMRVKIIEGMALGKIIVSTHIGAEGIGCRHNHEILLANTPEEMASAIVDCYRQNKWANAIAAKGATFVKQHFNTHRIHQGLQVFFNNLILV